MASDNLITAAERKFIRDCASVGLEAKLERTLAEACALLNEAADDANGVSCCFKREEIRKFLQTVEVEK